MSEDAHDVDVIVVGGGFAGVVAARDLADRGRSVRLLEVPFEQFPDMERIVRHCQFAAARITPGAPLDHQGLADLDVPFADFLAPLELPAETYEFVTAIAAVYLCRYPEEMSALAVLTSLAELELSAFAMWGVIDVRFADGASSLLDRIAAGLPDVRLSTPVTRVCRTDAGVTVTTAGGAEHTAAAAVVATPMNLWNDIVFEPPLSDTKRESSAERHGVERSGKAWLRVRGAPPNPFVIANPASNAGALMISNEFTFDDGDQLMPMFGVCSLPGDAYELDTADPSSAEKALHTLLPGSEMVAHHAHDFNADPWSKGDWVSYRPGRLSRSHSALGAPEGRLTFAGSDIAPKWITWIEGAVESGYQAARQTALILARGRG